MPRLWFNALAVLCLMPFPETPREIYERNPLTEVICQLRFPTILRISTDATALAELQERLRTEYPEFRQEEAQLGIPAEVSKMLPANFQAQFQVEPNYSFDSADGQRTITLNREAMSFTERDYRRWENFLEEVHRIKGGVEDIFAPSFYTRIGLRYQDVVDRSQLGLADIPWHELVKPAMAGLLGGESEVRDDVQEIVGTAELRVSEIAGGLVRLQYGLATRDDQTEKVYGMDADFFTSERSNPDDVSQILAVFNRHAGNYFRWSITDRLREALRPSPVEDGAGELAGS